MLLCVLVDRIDRADHGPNADDDLRVDMKYDLSELANLPDRGLRAGDHTID